MVDERATCPRCGSSVWVEGRAAGWVFLAFHMPTDTVVCPVNRFHEGTEDVSLHAWATAGGRADG